MVKSSSARSSGDNEGWKRGAGPYSRDYAKLDRPEDKVKARERITQVDRDEATGPVSRGGPPRYAPKNKAPEALTNGKISDRFDMTKGRKSR